MKTKTFWLWAIVILIVATILAAVQMQAGAFAIAPDGWMTATAEFEKVTCGWSGVKPDYCPTQTPKPILQLTQEFLEFCGSTPYQLQPGCPYEPTPEITLQTYPGIIIGDDDCTTVTYPGPECSIFDGADAAQYEQNIELPPTPTPTRWAITRPTNRKPRE